MSYRTYVNDVQVFGNGECYPEWIEFIKSQGINVDDEECYTGEIHDFMGALAVIEKIVLRLNKQREEYKESCGGQIGKRKIPSLFDFTGNIEKIINQSQDETEGYSLLDEIFDIINLTYAFMPYVFYNACKDALEPTNSYDSPNHFSCFKIKDGCSIVVEAH